jgi:DNA-binding XRE family transcriptional regulator
MITIEEVSKMIIDYRVKNDLSQKELADMLDISNKTLCNIENKENTVRNITLARVAMRLKGLKQHEK